MSSTICQSVLSRHLKDSFAKASCHLPLSDLNIPILKSIWYSLWPVNYSAFWASHLKLRFHFQQLRPIKNYGKLSSWAGEFLETIKTFFERSENGKKLRLSEIPLELWKQYRSLVELFLVDKSIKVFSISMNKLGGIPMSHPYLNKAIEPCCNKSIGAITGKDKKLQSY